MAWVNCSCKILSVVVSPSLGSFGRFMKNRSGLYLFAWSLFLLAACAQMPPEEEERPPHGTVTRVQFISVRSPAHAAAGALIPGFIGGVWGSGVGDGSGQDAAIVAGALGGVALGYNSQPYSERQPGQSLVVTLSDGVSMEIEQPGTDLRVGDRVYIEGKRWDARAIRY